MLWMNCWKSSLYFLIVSLSQGHFQPFPELASLHRKMFHNPFLAAIKTTHLFIKSCHGVQD